MSPWYLVTILLVVLIIIGGTLYGCQQSNLQYYAAQKNCVDAGGSWVPIGNNDNASCLRLK